jgi:hypothetical protein
MEIINEVQVRLVLEGEMAGRFLKIKEKYGLENNAEVVRLLITMEYEKITKNKK